MSNFISSIGLQQLSIKNLSEGQYKLSILNTQLATGKRSQNLTDYSSSNAQQLMNHNTSIAMRRGFLTVANDLKLRLTTYDKSLTEIEKIAGSAYSSALSASNYNADQNEAFASQIKGFMQQVTYYLDQKVGDRYIFAGTRFSRPPVGDITALPVPPTEEDPYVTTGNALPAYDTDYDPLNPSKQVSSAYVRDQVAIDTIQKITYGVTSTHEGFQKLVMGLRWAYAATQDVPNYDTNIARARDLISQGLTEIRGVHTDVSNAATTLEKTEELHNRTINDLIGQIDVIQRIEPNEVAIKITTFQAQLEASYAATAKMTNLSILKYL